MKRYFALSLLLIVSTSFVVMEVRGGAPAPRHRVVFEALRGPEQWETYMKNIANVQKALGADNVEIELVVHGEALHILRKDNPEVTEFVRSELKSLSGMGVKVAACRNSMRSRDVSKEELFPFTIVVDAALAEIIRKQEEGWAFIKLGW